MAKIHIRKDGWYLETEPRDLETLEQVADLIKQHGVFGLLGMISEILGECKIADDICRVIDKYVP